MLSLYLSPDGRNDKIKAGIDEDVFWFNFDFMLPEERVDVGNYFSSSMSTQHTSREVVLTFILIPIEIGLCGLAANIYTSYGFTVNIRYKFTRHPCYVLLRHDLNKPVFKLFHLFTVMHLYFLFYAKWN